MRIACVLVLAACGGGGAARTVTPTAAAPPAHEFYLTPSRCEPPVPNDRPATIRGINWCDHRYAVSPIEMTFEVYAGSTDDHYETPTLCGEGISERYRVREVAYGDLDGDGVEDAVVAIDHEFQGCSNIDRSTELRAFRLLGGAAIPIAGTATTIVDESALAGPPTLEISDHQITRTYRWPDGKTCRARWRLLEHDQLDAVDRPCAGGQ